MRFLQNSKAMWIVGIATLLLQGCITTSAVEKRNAEIAKVINEVHGPSTVCAPRELAYAEMYMDVARYESGRGDSVLSRNHIKLASDLTAELWEVAQRPECETDTDDDGLVDSIDECPEEPEDYDGLEDEDGCPEEDRDGDELSDRYDQCPNNPEDYDSFEDDDGCPELDNDNDGLVDTQDQCPNQAEDRDQFEDDDGCPDPDNDGDTIADLEDKCPNEPEDFDGDADEDGCPDLYKNIVVTDNMIALKEKVFFKTNKSKILPQSFEMLNEVADVLQRKGDMNVRIEGHTDSRGSNRSNKKLSQNRANSVQSYLIGQAVPPSQLNAEGRGEEEPIESNDTDEGRAKNRRVEFHIVP
jgi:outer membrane protein OmpA-like peptidoglycan-associated protein